ncbi:hypothetical protein EX30DRAFT_360701 [Ascodesmis nigricans]|uniref:Uncharacterized protein n=1 Tax=Ascodesmis nigricans TaxID=341454 RepID=A0A4S2N5V9_9PEZI|nr:hypothetical protein EX30DRAFT_360701 [Ascodesmis nigricans]
MSSSTLYFPSFAYDSEGLLAYNENLDSNNPEEYFTPPSSPSTLVSDSPAKATDDPNFDYIKSGRRWNRSADMTTDEFELERCLKDWKSLIKHGRQCNCSAAMRNKAESDCEHFLQGLRMVLYISSLARSASWYCSPEYVPWKAAEDKGALWEPLYQKLHRVVDWEGYVKLLLRSLGGLDMDRIGENGCVNCEWSWEVKQRPELVVLCEVVSGWKRLELVEDEAARILINDMLNFHGSYKVKEMSMKMEQENT